ncbi:MAG TPA: hypothetical protein PKW80_09525 [Bacteroidales bacterium]|nr:hypothetical protein [Bacteroidales bacterium]
MNTSLKKFVFVFLTCSLFFAVTGVFAQMKTYDWEPYKTQFKVPSDFVVTESSGTKWSGKNGDIALTIYPRKDENLSHSEMLDAVYEWAVKSGVKDIGDPVELDTEKLNGYWGYLYEGTVDGFPVGTMLIVDPDYPEISLYIWVSYREGFEDTVIDMLMSFIPM